MASIPVIPNSVAANSEVDIVTVTAVNTGVGGIAGRLAVTKPKRKFTCTVGPADAPAVRMIYYTHRSRWPVAIRDWGEYIFEDEELTYSAGDSSNYLAPLRRLIQAAPGARYWHQRVLLPDESDPDFPAVIKVDGVALPRDVWVFDDFGIANIPQVHVPSGSVITWSGRAFVPVVFQDGSLAIQISVKQQNITDYGVQSIQTVTLNEIFEEELINLMTETDDSI